MEEDYNPVDKFFEECFLINFCPLIFKNDSKLMESIGLCKLLPYLITACCNLYNISIVLINCVYAEPFAQVT